MALINSVQKYKVVDAHHHAWQYSQKEFAWISDDMEVLRKDFMSKELQQVFAANDIFGSVAVQARQSEEETLFLLDLTSENEFILGVVGWVDLCSKHIANRLSYFSRFEKLKGFRHVVQDESDDQFMLGESFLRGVSALSEYNFTYDILIYPKQLSAAIELVQRFPNQRFVIDQMAKPLIKDKLISDWEKSIRRLAECPNVWCKVSGMITEANWHEWSHEDLVPYLDVIFDAFDLDKIMFGSDYPVCLLAGSYMEVKQVLQKYLVRFSEEDQAKVWSENATKFYKL